MKTLRALGTFAHLSIQASGLLALPLATLGAGVLLPACADENDPKTWVKRLDDPAQRAPAIKRLAQFFEDTMTKVKKDREAPELKALLDDIVAPMTSQYTAGNLDDKTRKELMKALGDMRDPRTAPALAKALNEYDPGKNDEDVKYAAQSVIGMAALGKTLDASLVDALWAVFSKFRASQAKSINLLTDLHDAVLAVKSPTYGPKAVEKLAGPVDPKSPESQRDQIQFWQLTSIQVIRDLKFTPGVKPLVKVLLTQEKKDLWATTEAALMHMPKEAEPVLVSVIKGDDPELAKLSAAFGDDKSQLALAADALGWLSRTGGRDAVFNAAGAVDSDANRQAFGMSIVKFPIDGRSLGVFRGLYDGIKGNEDSDITARAAMLQSSSQFYDPSLTGWLLKEIGNAKGDSATALQLPALEAAIKLMTPDQQGAVGGVATKLNSQMDKIGSQQEKGTASLLKAMYEGASAMLTQCQQNVSCYTKQLEEPVATGKEGANAKAIKSAWMSVIYAGAAKDQVRGDLVSKLEKVKNPGARLAVVEAIDRLAPTGDPTAAAAMEKIVEADKSSGDKLLLQADDSVVKVALRLRARAN
jgi:hypothetical protein